MSSFVTFEKFGAAKVVVMVENGQTVVAPFAAGDGYVWMVGSAAYDFAAGVTEDITVKAVKANVCDVKIVSTGAVTAEETVTVAEGSAFDFSTLEKAGYDFVVISEEGKVITELTVVGETTLNVIYTQR